MVAPHRPQGRPVPHPHPQLEGIQQVVSPLVPLQVQVQVQVEPEAEEDFHSVPERLRLVVTAKRRRSLRLQLLSVVVFRLGPRQIQDQLHRHLVRHQPLRNPPPPRTQQPLLLRRSALDPARRPVVNRLRVSGLLQLVRHQAVRPKQARDSRSGQLLLDRLRHWLRPLVHHPLSRRRNRKRPRVPRLRSVLEANPKLHRLPLLVLRHRRHLERRKRPMQNEGSQVGHRDSRH